MPDKKNDLKILLVDDNPGDAQLVIESARDLRLPAQFSVVNDGEKALDLLRVAVREKTGNLPNLILLDLNLPRKDGWIVLREIKNDPLLRCVPVVVLTSSKSEKDVQAAYDLSANGYLIKPRELTDLGLLIKSIVDFWEKNITTFSATQF